MTRELAIPGTVFVSTGQIVAPDTLIARSTRQFLRPFFLNGASALGVGPEEYPQSDERRTQSSEHRTQNTRMLCTLRSVFCILHSVSLRILPDGTIVVREKPELAREFTTVDVSKELGLEHDQVKPYLRVEVGEPLDKGQWIAAKMDSADFKIAKSPVRGKVNRIALK